MDFSTRRALEIVSQACSVEVVARDNGLGTNRMNLRCLWYMQKEAENADLEFGQDICVGYKDLGINNMQELTHGKSMKFRRVSRLRW